MTLQPLSSRLERAGLQEGQALFFPLEGDGVQQVFQALDTITGSGYNTWVLEREILPFYRRRAEEQARQGPGSGKDACRIPDGTYDSLVCCTWSNALADLKAVDGGAFTGMLRKILVDPFLRASRVRDLQAACQDRINQVWEDYQKNHPGAQPDTLPPTRSGKENRP